MLRIAASYTFLDATVTDSFSGSALDPSINPTFPSIEIGAFSPLVGARPFRRPTHSGSLLATATAGRAQVTLAVSFVGKSDDSTFLFDQFFENSLLLPNRDLADGYQKVDLSGAYRVHPRLRWYVSCQRQSALARFVQRSPTAAPAESDVRRRRGIPGPANDNPHWRRHHDWRGLVECRCDSCSGLRPRHPA